MSTLCGLRIVVAETCYAPDHCECSQRWHITMDPSYWHRFIFFTVSSVIHFMLTPIKFYAYLIYRCFQINWFSLFSLLIWKYVSQVIILVVSGFLQHNLFVFVFACLIFQSYKLKAYSIESSGNKMCSFTHLSSLPVRICILVWPWSCKLIFSQLFSNSCVVL